MANANLKLVETSSMDKQKALDAALGQIERAYGKGSVMKLGQNKVMEIEAISTGSLGLDIALGIGGLPKGRVIEIYGPESSGKTTLAIHAIAECQKKGGIAAFIDAEHAFDKTYAEKLGIDTENLLISASVKLTLYRSAIFNNTCSRVFFPSILKYNFPCGAIVMVMISISGNLISETDEGVSTITGSSALNLVVSIKNVTSKNARSTIGVISSFGDDLG